MMTAINQNSEAFLLYRDATKDAYGFRMNPTATTQEELESDYARVCDDIQESIQKEHEQQLLCWDKLVAKIEEVSEYFGGSRKKAIISLIEAEDIHFDIEFFCYLWGVSYSKKNEILEMMR